MRRSGARQATHALMVFMLGCFAAWYFVTYFVTLPAAAWDHWGGNRGGTRFSPLQQITPANVGRLVRCWEFHTGDLARAG